MAACYLEKNGYRILERNWRPAGWKRGELDLIAECGSEVVFVEVKTRRGLAYGRPEEAVDWRKQRQLAALAQVWLRENRASHRPCRIDVIAIVWSGREVRLRHLKAAVRSQP